MIRELTEKLEVSEAQLKECLAVVEGKEKYVQQLSSELQQSQQMQRECEEQVS